MEAADLSESTNEGHASEEKQLALDRQLITLTGSAEELADRAAFHLSICCCSNSTSVSCSSDSHSSLGMNDEDDGTDDGDEDSKVPARQRSTEGNGPATDAAGTL